MSSSDKEDTSPVSSRKKRQESPLSSRKKTHESPLSSRKKRQGSRSSPAANNKEDTAPPSQMTTDSDIKTEMEKSAPNGQEHSSNSSLDGREPLVRATNGKASPPTADSGPQKQEPGQKSEELQEEDTVPPVTSRKGGRSKNNMRKSRSMGTGLADQEQDTNVRKSLNRSRDDNDVPEFSKKKNFKGNRRSMKSQSLDQPVDKSELRKLQEYNDGQREAEEAQDEDRDFNHQEASEMDGNLENTAQGRNGGDSSRQSLQRKESQQSESAASDWSGSNISVDNMTPNPNNRKFSGRSTLPRSDTLSSGLTSEAADEDTCINVVVRVRPLSQQELVRKDKNLTSFPGGGGIWVDTGTITKSFTFNVTFEPEAAQEDVFEHSGIKKLVDMAINGYSCTCFAFGQTGSGKTHTITGPPELFQDSSRPNPDLYGLIPRCFHYMFQLMRSKPSAGYRITASYLEIYNEQVIDLLNPSQRQSLAVRWSKNRGFYVENLFVIECDSMDDMMAVLEEGE